MVRICLNHVTSHITGLLEWEASQGEDQTVVVPRRLHERAKRQEPGEKPSLQVSTPGLAHLLEPITVALGMVVSKVFEGRCVCV